MFRTGTCVDTLIPEGLSRHNHLLVLAETDAEMAMLTWVGTVTTELPKTYPEEVRVWAPGDIADSDVFNQYVVMLPISNYGEMNPGTIEVLFSRSFCVIAYGSHADLNPGTGLNYSSQTVLHFEKPSDYKIRLVKDTRHPPRQGWVVPYLPGHIPPPVRPPTVWERLDED